MRDGVPTFYVWTRGMGCPSSYVWAGGRGCATCLVCGGKGVSRSAMFELGDGVLYLLCVG